MKTFLGKGDGAEVEVGRGVRIIVLEAPLLIGTFEIIHDKPSHPLFDHISKQYSMKLDYAMWNVHTIYGCVSGLARDKVQENITQYKS